MKYINHSPIDILNFACAAEEKGELEEAKRLYSIAIRMGVPEAMVNLANILIKNRDDLSNRRRAIYLYRKAVYKGIAESAANLAILYRNEKNRRMFDFWKNKATLMGDKWASEMFFDGRENEDGGK